MIVDYRKRRTEHAPILIDSVVVEQVESFKFHITNKLTWSKHNKTAVKRAHQNLFPLRRLKRFGMGPQILKKFYSCTIESILTGCITTWYGNCLVVIVMLFFSLVYLVNIFLTLLELHC